MKIAIGCDDVSYNLKFEIMEEVKAGDTRQMILARYREKSFYIPMLLVRLPRG